MVALGDSEKLMNPTSLLLKAYYEALYELLAAQRETLTDRVNAVLDEEIRSGGYEDFDDEKFNSYYDACLAFIDERIEMYNPFGIQYLYDRDRTKEAFKLELQLNWYDSRPEFESLVETAGTLVENLTGRQDFERPVKELMKIAGAFPDRSIISAYHEKPALNKLPDYVVAKVIEEIIA
jgi:hypothetical protein